MKSAKAIVFCKIHGTKNSKNDSWEVKVNVPDNKRQKYSGCPMCRAEANKKVGI